MDPLPELFLNRSGQGETNPPGQTVVFFFEAQEDPAMLEDIQDGRDIPKGGDEERDLPAHPPQFGKKPVRILHMLDRMGTKDRSELPVPKGQTGEIADPDKSRDRRMAGDVGIDASSVGFAAADVQIPCLTPEDASLEIFIADRIQNPAQNEDRGNSGG